MLDNEKVLSYVAAFVFAFFAIMLGVQILRMVF